MWWIAGAAMGGMWVGPADLPAPGTTATRVATLRTASRTDATFTQDVQGAPEGLGWLLAVPRSGVLVEAGAAAALINADTWSAPAVRSPRCADLVQAAPVGCGEAPPPLPAVPVDHAILPIPGFANGTWELAVLDETLGEVTTWLDARGWAAPPGGAEEIARLASVDQVFAAAAWLGTPPPDGSFLPPVRVAWDEATWEIPLRFSHFNTVGLHDAVVLTLTPLSEGTPFIPNYERAEIERDCMPAADSPEAWYDDALDRTLPLVNVVPGWLTEQASSLDACPECVGPPPDAGALGWVAAEVPWVSRLHMRYSSAGLDQDPTLSMSGVADEVHRGYWSYRPEIEFAFPVCDEGYREDPGSCEPVHVRTRAEAGCSTSPATGLLGALLAASILRRRRAALLCALLLSGRASAQSPAPGLAVAAELPIWSTVRLGDEKTGERGAPSSLYPSVGVSGRVALWRAQSTAVSAGAGLRAFAGRASTEPAEQYVLWTFFEPHAGLAVTHGGLGERYATPMCSWGAEAALGILDASVYRPQRSLGPLIHARGGVWLGNSPATRTEVALLASVIPLPSAQVVDFASETLLPGWRFNEGAASLHLVVGGVWAAGPR